MSSFENYADTELLKMTSAVASNSEEDNFGGYSNADERDLHIQNKILLEKINQQVYDIQTERESVRLRLIAVESDYDSQLKELQSEIIRLRNEYLSQKRAHSQINNENKEYIADLTEQNILIQERLNNSTASSRELSIQVKELQEQLISSRVSIQNHVHHIESLQVEISQLQEDKVSLEKQLRGIIEERDSILNSLSDAQMTTDLLQIENENQKAALTHQDRELVKLQETAAILTEQLSCLDMGGSSALCSGSTNLIFDSSPNNVLHFSHPHQSLFGELSSILPQDENVWQQKRNPLSMCRSDSYGDDGIEMDDESFLAISCGLHGNSENPHALNGENCSFLDACSDENMNQLADFNPAFMDGFRSEVAEIYNQLRQMCLDFSARSTTLNYGMKDENASSSRPGDCTPDQLALLEWDFRLASLRSVLTDLRFLLHDLVSSSVVEPCSPPMARHPRSSFSYVCFPPRQIFSCCISSECNKFVRVLLSYCYKLYMTT